MPTQLKQPSIQFTVLAIGLVVFAGLAFALSAAGIASSDNGQGKLGVNGVEYVFSPATCSVSDSDFVTAGPGSLDGEPFWISASGDRLNLAVGQQSETDRPGDDELWLVSVNPISWTMEDGAIIARATMRDERDPTSEAFEGTLSVQCPEPA